MVGPAIFPPKSFDIKRKQPFHQKGNKRVSMAMGSRKRAAAITQSSSKEDEKEWQDTQLPLCILMEILSRLSIKSLFTCRLVCKLWLRLISDSHFAKLHLARSPTSILIQTIPPKNKSRKLQLTQIKQNRGTSFDVTRIKFSPKINLRNCDIDMVNSCNGFLCLYASEEIYICNPILGEYLTISLPKKDNNRGSNINSIGLGFSVKTNEYKVIRTFYSPIASEPFGKCQMAEIYTIGNGEWRSLGNVAYSISCLPFNTFLNGALHWVSDLHKGLDFIQSFDFESEQFQSIPPPPPPSECDSVEKNFANSLILGVLGGCLSLSVSFYHANPFDIWVMKEYGVKESWTRQYVIANVYMCDNHLDFYEPIVVLERGEILMLFNNEIVVCYNMERESFRETRISRTQGELCAIAYTPCFVSLSSIAKGEDLKASRIQGTKKYDKFFPEGVDNCAGNDLLSSGVALEQ